MAEAGLHDVYEDMEGYIGPTHWSKPYFSNHLHETPASRPEMLRHVNCAYLSTPGRPPTLEALKQHAQSLTYLISTIAPSTIGGEIDNENTPGSDPLTTFEEGEAYDWLNNLQIPYDNIETAHRRPLNSLLNLVKRNSDERGVEFQCPLTELTIDPVERSDRDFSRRPFQTHLTLLMHANECLERLDHEYSPLGGLLAVMPTDQEAVGVNTEVEKAKSTLVGQWILYTQRLVYRMHELEIAYANSLDLLANEAVVPAQHISIHGPDGRSGREIVFPQDRWILANAGEDVFSFVHEMLDKKEGMLSRQEVAWGKQGVVGETLQREVQEEDDDALRGIAHVDLQTRFYRLRGNGHGPIFVLPAFGDRPNTAVTREMENRPTVVALPRPGNPGPGATSAWDRRTYGIERRLADETSKVADLTIQVNQLTSDKLYQEGELRRLRHLNKVYEEGYGQEEIDFSNRIQRLETERDNITKRYEEDAITRNEMIRQLDRYRNAAKAEQTTDRVPTVDETEPGKTWTINKPLYDLYVNRSTAIQTAKAGLDRTRSTLQQLAEQGHIDLSDFAWMENLSNVA